MKRRRGSRSGGRRGEGRDPRRRADGEILAAAANALLSAGALDCAFGTSRDGCWNQGREALRRAGPIQRELAEKAGVGRVTISRIERGAQTLSVDVALAIGRVLGELVEALFGGGA